MATENGSSASSRKPEVIISSAELVRKDGEVPWSEVEINARELANGLRSKDSTDQHTVLGSGSLPASIVVLLTEAHKGNTPDRQLKLASFELLRLVANLCMDHDVNRQHFLDAKFHDIALSLIQTHTSFNATCLDDLRVAKTAVGALLNSCLNFEPARTYLISLGAPTKVVALSTTLYPAGKWARTSMPSEQLEEAISIYQVRIGLVDWSWRLLSAITDESKVSALGAESVNSILASLPGFVPGQAPSSPLIEHSESRNALVDADLESLQESVGILEALSLDSEDFRLAFAKDEDLFTPILDFVEKADYPEYWKLDSEELDRRKKTFDMCKTVVIKALVSIAGESKIMDDLWKKDALVQRCVSWVRENGAADRDDLVIAGCLSLGNLARKDAHCEALLRPPYRMAAALVDLLKPDADIKVKHAITGLLKNLAQSSNNRRLLGESGILEQLVRSGIWEQGCDMAESVQVSGIGTAKHLCNGDAGNTLRLMGTQPTSGVDQLIALVQRSDSVVVKSEGTRVIGYCVKSLWKKDASSMGTQNFDSRVQEGRVSLSEAPVVRTLAHLLVTGQKHGILLNESTFSLTLIANHDRGAATVLEALNTPVTVPSPSSDGKVAAIESRGLEVLRLILVNDGNKYAPELRANACSLITAILRHVNEDEPAKGQLISTFSPLLQGISENMETPEKLKQAAKQAVDAF